MATILTHRPIVNGTIQNSNNAPKRQASLSSFPPSRTPSDHSPQNGGSRRMQSTAQRSDSSSRRSASPSSANLARKSAGSKKNTRILRPQYPAGALERHVEYILVASFDIDRGPVMEHQYPGAISGNENMLAELMLPDQAHIRNQDWTIFFLHKDNGDPEDSLADRRSEDLSCGHQGSSTETNELDTNDGVQDRSYQEVAEGIADKEDDQELDEVVEGPPLIYVLNLVNTKQDNTVKRGAVVKAMAICTRHSFLHIYKPLLLLALEDYFRSPFPETLAKLYQAVNSMDLSLMPRLTSLERHVLQSSSMKDLFIEKFEQMIWQRTIDEASSRSTKMSDSPSKSLNDCSRLGAKYPLPRDTHEYETRVIYNSIPIPIKVPTAISPETVGDFSIIKLIQTFAASHMTSPQPFALHPHLTTSGAYTHPIIVLVNAMLTQKRIIFLGHNRPSGEVAEAVLAACALVSGGVLRGFTRHAFPYTDLSKIDDLLKVPGFLAGVTNPTFANHPEWWDLLCDISTGRIKISDSIGQAPITEGLVYFQQNYPAFAPNASGIGGGPSLTNPGSDPAGDHVFMADILRSISSRHGEPAIRSKWRDYISKFTRIAAAFEESVYGASALFIGASEADVGAYGISGHGYVWPDELSRGKELGANVWRIEGWRNTRSYYSFIQDLAALWGRRPIRKLDLGHQLDKLRQVKLGREDSGKIFLALSESIKGYDEICQLLTVTPENHAGLFYISLGLLHPDMETRNRTADLLGRIAEHEAGRHFWTSLGRFAKSAYTRIKREGVLSAHPGRESEEEMGPSTAGRRS